MGGVWMRICKSDNAGRLIDGVVRVCGESGMGKMMMMMMIDGPLAVASLRFFHLRRVWNCYLPSTLVAPPTSPRSPPFLRPPRCPQSSTRETPLLAPDNPLQNLQVEKGA